MYNWLGKVPGIFKSKKGVIPKSGKMKDKPSKKLTPSNPFVVEVTKKGIKLHKEDITKFQMAIVRPIDLIPQFLHSRAREPWSSPLIKSTMVDIDNGEIGDNALLKILSSLNIMWPEEIICSDCTEGVVPLCEHCNEGYVTCDNCEGNWDQECGECGGDGDWDCDECHGGRIECGECGGSVPDCNECEGEGEIPCPECEGHNFVDCISCDSKGNCSYCEGVGKTLFGIDEEGKEDWDDCDFCASAGVCEDCGGGGEIPCEVCDAGEKKIRCENCDGSGEIACDECDGEGDIECVACGGEGHHYCESCEGGRWYCQECEEGSYGCGECNGNWEEHNCPACGANGKWNEENSETFVKLKELCESPRGIEEKKSNLISGFSALLGESIYVPPHWRKKPNNIALEKQEFIKNINWKVHYYDAFDFNPKNLNINSLSLLIVPGFEEDIQIYTISSSKLTGDIAYPTLLNKASIKGSDRLPFVFNFINGKNQYGDYLNLGYLQSPAYEESKVIIMRSDWYYLMPPFLNWLEENPLLEKD